LDQKCPERSLERLRPPNQDVGALGLSLDWTFTASYNFPKAAHVNIQEARAISRCVKREANISKQPFRMLLLSDSMVCVGAFGKGRSSSFQLNGVLRSMLGYSVVAGIELCILWISTKCNPADFLSRFVPLPPPLKLPDRLNVYFDGRVSRHRGRYWGIEIFRGLLF
jgi:hypothetical protein